MHLTLTYVFMYLYFLSACIIHDNRTKKKKNHNKYLYLHVFGLNFHRLLSNVVLVNPNEKINYDMSPLRKPDLR